ncbi:Na-translocating system protein MpsC family protein [Halanaerobium sp.]|uniref:Na-translocating system protein MpsC family protein n=1 Tax=Halanaerobium sp. TaxID=1895664 RepID=UPI000DE60115|nr:Na-translocating system protein MpsC family protein [Halanaerobium sp.]PUU90160.1 MAG: hypothetical protein CI949_2459 [Halanaerobium sp.]
MHNFSDLNKELSNLYKEYTGRGPKYIKSYFVDDVLIIKINWYEEKIFNKIANDEHGKNVVKTTYKNILKYWGEEAKKAIENVTGIDVLGMYFDEEMALLNNDKVVVFLLNNTLN